MKSNKHNPIKRERNYEKKVKLENQTAPMDIDTKEIQRPKSNLSIEQSTLKIQSFFRGYRARKNYGVKQLQEEKRQKYKAFVVGNDPVFTGINKLVKEEKVLNPFAVIGTSVLRGVEIAMQIRRSKFTYDEKISNTMLPKLIIVDNSREVNVFWRNLRIFVSQYSDEKQFLKNLPNFLEENKELYRKIEDNALENKEINYPNQNIVLYFENLLKSFGSDVLRVISSATVLAQRWEDTNFCNKLKNVLDFLQIKDVYMYPSNVASSASSLEDRQIILNNVVTFKPKISVYSNLSFNYEMPTSYLITKKNNPKEVIDWLNDTEDSDDDSDPNSDSSLYSFIVC